MRVLHIGKYYPPFFGGIENFMAALLPEQVRSGWEVDCLVHNHVVSFRTVSEDIDGVKVIRAPILFKLLFVPVSLVFPFLLRKLISNHKPDIIHVHVPNASAFWLLFCLRNSDIPIVIQWQSDVVASKYSKGLSFFYNFYKPFEQALLKKSQRVIVASPPYLESSIPLQKWKSKSQIIPLGLFDGDIAESGLPVPKVFSDKVFKTLCVGRLSYYKGHKYLVNAVAELPDVELIIIGDGDESPSVGRQIADLDLGERVRLLKDVSNTDLREIYKQADCFCLPSIERTEAFGMVLLEAMREALPVITTSVPGSGMSWIVQDGITGLVVEPESADALATAIQGLSKKPDRAKRLGVAGERRYREVFSIESIATGINKIYAELLAG